MFLVANLKKNSVRAMVLVCFLLAAAMLAAPDIMVRGIKSGLLLCYNAIIPSLFPFLFIVDYLFSILCSSKTTQKWVCVVAAIFFGLCGGTPMGAKALARLVDSGTLDSDKASRVLAGSVNAGPAFLISAVGLGLFGNIRAGLLLFCVLTLSSLVCIGLALLLPSGRQISAGFSQKKTSTPPKAASFTKSISSALDSILGLCAYVTFFSCIGAYAEELCRSFSLSPVISWLAKSLLDLSTACVAASEIGSVTGLYLAAAAVSFLGISVLFQVNSIIKNTGMTARYLWVARPLHAGLSSLFLWILIPMFPDIADVFAGPIAHKIYSLSPVFSIFFLMTAFVFIFGERKKPTALNM